VNTFFVTNANAFTANYMNHVRMNNRPNAFMVPAYIGGGTGHGTKMASIAAGRIHGIARNADLYLLKTKGQWDAGPPSREITNGPIEPAAMASVLGEVRRHVESRLATNPRAKSVINMSFGELLFGDFDRTLV
jgi:hypothetical protein